MVSEPELRKAIDAGSRYSPVVHAIFYNLEQDEISLDTPWGRLTIKRDDIPIFRGIEPHQMQEIYASHTGIHIDEIDFDVSAAGLLEQLFHALAGKLSSSY